MNVCNFISLSSLVLSFTFYLFALTTSCTDICGLIGLLFIVVSLLISLCSYYLRSVHTTMVEASLLSRVHAEPIAPPKIVVHIENPDDSHAVGTAV